MPPLEVTKTADPLASLRIDRTRRSRSGVPWGRLFVVLLLVLSLGGVGAYVWSRYGAEIFRTQVHTAAVEVHVPGVTDSVLKAQGYIKSLRQAAIGAKVPGRIERLPVIEGQRVEEGDLLAELEHKDLDASLRAMDASLEAMQASLEKSTADLAEVEANLAQDERDLVRFEQLYRSRGLSGSEYERARANVAATRRRRDSLKAGVDLARTRIKEAEARVEETTEQIKNMTVRAPFAGTVISKESEVGETIALGGMGAGSASGRGSVVTLADLAHLDVDADVKEDFVNLIQPKQPANIAVDAVPGRLYKGRVRTIIPMGDRARGTIKVKVEILNVDDRLFPEMAATVHFLSEAKDPEPSAVKLVYAPADAVKHGESGSFVWRVVGDRVQRIAVETGEARDGKVLVESGLAGNEELVLNPPDSLKPNLPVKVVH